MASWDDDDFDPDAGFQQPERAAVSDRWEGEDEPEDVKDAWDDDDEEEGEKKEEDKPPEVKAFQVKKKKNKIEEAAKKKEEKRRQTIEEFRAKEGKKELTPEEQAAEKLKQQRLQEEADLEVTKETFGGENDESVLPTIDKLNPKTKDDFNKFSKLLKEKLAKLEDSPFYVDFMEDLIKDCCINMDTDHVRRIGSSLTLIANEKAKVEKAVKSKKKSKKAVLGGGLKGNKRDEFDADLRYDEMEDFI